MKISIDFGTSFSLAATSYLGTKSILLPAGKYGIPSVFYYDSWDGIAIGEEAEDLGQGENAKNLKREIKLELNSNFNASGRTFTAKEIAGYILKHVKEIAVHTASENLINEKIYLFRQIFHIMKNRLLKRLLRYLRQMVVQV